MVQGQQAVNAVIEEIEKIQEYAKLDPLDIENAIWLSSLLCTKPIVETTNYGLCFTYPRLEILFDNGEIFYFRYKTDRKYSWRPVEIGVGAYETGFFQIELIDKINNELKLLP